MIKNIYDKEVTAELIQRIENLNPDTQPKWGKMNVAQMLAHLNVTYELAFEDKHPKPGFFKRLLLKLFVKPVVTNTKKYKKGGPTAPEFKVPEKQDFETQKRRLIDYINKTRELGSDYFENREYTNFGKMTAREYNNMFYKHLDHHLSQFGV